MKQGRIELRATEKERKLLLEAAEYSGMSLSAFLRQAALEKSDDILRRRDILTLSDRDRDLFLEALENPPKPNKRLKLAVYKYKKLKINLNVSDSNPPLVRRTRSKQKTKTI